MSTEFRLSSFESQIESVCHIIPNKCVLSSCYARPDMGPAMFTPSSLYINSPPAADSWCSSLETSRPIETYLLEDTNQPPSPIILTPSGSQRNTSGQYASYRNAFLFLRCLCFYWITDFWTNLLQCKLTLIDEKKQWICFLRDLSTLYSRCTSRF